MSDKDQQPKKTQEHSLDPSSVVNPEKPAQLTTPPPAEPSKPQQPSQPTTPQTPEPGKPDGRESIDPTTVLPIPDVKPVVKPETPPPPPPKKEE
jgi:hypothetical protein